MHRQSLLPCYLPNIIKLRWTEICETSSIHSGEDPPEVIFLLLHHRKLPSINLSILSEGRLTNVLRPTLAAAELRN